MSQQFTLTDGRRIIGDGVKLEGGGESAEYAIERPYQRPVYIPVCDVVKIERVASAFCCSPEQCRDGRCGRDPVCGN